MDYRRFLISSGGLPEDLTVLEATSIMIIGSRSLGGKIICRCRECSGDSESEPVSGRLCMPNSDRSTPTVAAYRHKKFDLSRMKREASYMLEVLRHGILQEDQLMERACDEQWLLQEL